MGVADQSAFHGKNGGAAQPAGTLARHVDHDARFAVLGEFDALHPAYGEARKSQVHADLGAFGVLRHQHHALLVLEYAARVEHIAKKPHYQRERKREQHRCLEFDVRNQR